ncbi:MAG: type IV pilus assembly protein PilV [Psychromonas sp.]|jgi:type IV pilus assembly protein PilV|uniref:type IV pilus modification PilV family protein n=1 Tax=Psychromonas sp. TaxID=1884585 RepID=UPI0039E34A78
MKKTEKGFTLFEVLVSLFIIGVALLGIAQMEVYILKSSQSSFNYTVATIRANSFVDAVWADLCNAQEASASLNTYAEIRTDWIAEVSDAGMTATETYTSADKTSIVTIRWTDPRFTDDDLNNTLTLDVEFPDSGCGE